MAKYIANMSMNRYNRVYWVTPLLDTIQYYVSLATVAITLVFCFRHVKIFGVINNLQEPVEVTDQMSEILFNFYF